MTNFTCIEWLANPVTPQTFFNDYFEKKPLIIKRNDPGYFRDLLTLQDIDVFLDKAGHLGRFDLVMLKANERIHHYDYSNVIKVQNLEIKTGIDINRTLDMFGNGRATILINKGLNEWNPLNDLVQQYSREMLMEAGANIFITPRNAQCFGAHFDEYDLFILQVHGKKHWQIFESPVYLPSEAKNESNFDFSGLKLIDELDLEQGDTLYLPRGYVHKVTTDDAVSVHVTLGGKQITWSEVLKYYIDELSRENGALASSLLFDESFSDNIDQYLATVRNTIERDLTLDKLDKLFLAIHKSEGNPVSSTSQLFQEQRAAV